MTEDLDLAVTVACPLWSEHVPAVEALSKAAAAAAFQAAVSSPGPAEAALVLADDETVKKLNRDYRGKNRPTNVLSFPASDGTEPDGAPVLLGDVIVAFETADREASEEGKSLADHLSHLIVHGMLHLMGFDHQTEEEAAEMERLEVEVLAGLGIADPYGGPDA